MTRLRRALLSLAVAFVLGVAVGAFADANWPDPED